MNEKFEVTGLVQRFAGDRGWFYVELPDEPGFDLRQRVNDTWPQLVSAQCSLGATIWTGSVMPVKDGPLFITLTKPVREAERVVVHDTVTVSIELAE